MELKSFNGKGYYVSHPTTRGLLWTGRNNKKYKTFDAAKEKIKLEYKLTSKEVSNLSFKELDNLIYNL